MRVADKRRLSVARISVRPDGMPCSSQSMEPAGRPPAVIREDCTSVRPILAALGVAILLSGCGAGARSFQTPPRIVAAGAAKTASASSFATVAPSAPAASSTPSGVSTSDSSVPLRNAGVAAVSATSDVGVVGFAVSIDSAAGIATVGPGWAIENGTLVEVYAGGSISLPSTLAPASTTGATPWPVLLAVADTTSWATSTTARVAVTIPEECGPGASFLYPLTACPTGPNGQGPTIDLTDAVTRIGVVGESFQFYVNGTLEQESYPNPTWLLYQNTDPHVAWSGGGVGSGTPTYIP